MNTTGPTTVTEEPPPCSLHASALARAIAPRGDGTDAGRVISTGFPNISIPGWLNVRINRIAASPLMCRLAKGTFWSFAGSVVARGLSFAASVYIARILGKSNFGELGIIQNTLGMFGALAGFGLGLTSSKHVAELRVADPARAGGVMVLSHIVALVSASVISVVLYVTAPLLAGRTLAD